MAANASWKEPSPSGTRRALILLFTVVCHGVAFVYILGNYEFASVVVQQLRLLVIASLMCAGVALIFRSKTILAYALAFRLLAIVLAVALLEGKSTIAEVLLLVPFFVESTDRFHWMAGLMISASAVLIVVLVDFLSLFPIGALTAIQHIAILLVVLTPISGMSCALSRRSHLLEEKTRRLNELGRAVENLTNSNKAFQDYAETIGSLSTEQERNRITRELHDLTGYALTNIIMLMNAGRVFLQEDPGKLKEVLDNTKQQADETLTEVRRILYQLRAIKTPGPTGLHAISHLVRTFSDATNVRVSINYGNFPMSYGEQVDEVIYRIVQEGLTNALKHGKAREVTIILWETEKDIIVSVGDNGAGAGEVHEGIGLKGIKERLCSLGGSLEVVGTNYGFELVSRIPLFRVEVVKEDVHGSYKDNDR